MTMKNGAKFEEELACWHEEFDKFWSEHLKGSKNFILMCSFWSKYILFELKTAEELSLMKLNRDGKFGQELSCHFKIGKGIWQILTWALKSLKNFDFNGPLLSKVYIVWAKKYIQVIFHENKEGYKIWRGTDLSFQNWHKEFDKFWSEHLNGSKIFILMHSFWAKYILFELKSAEELSLMKLNRDAKFGQESSCHFKIGKRNLINFDLSTWKSQKLSF